MLAGGYAMDRLEFRQIHPASIPGLLPMILGAALMVCAVLLAVQVVGTAGAVFASQAAYAMAFGGIVWGMLLLGEGLSPLAWGALVFILVGLYLVEPRTEGEFRHSLSIKRKRASRAARA